MTTGYYTTKWEGEPLPASARMALEVEFAREFEANLGGSEAATATCLAAADGTKSALEAIKAAASAAERDLRARRDVPEGKFSIRAWTASQL